MIDAGIVPEQPLEEYIITREQWLAATRDEIEELRNLQLYTNQEYQWLEEVVSGNVKVRLRYSTPCITSLREVKV
ncbi:hypothetical protein SEA_JEMERALD_52 [Microbacterium phage Jemerald]|nr:hypothetical protein SEA_JUICER_52 [Microbacterium phage Juicer]WNO27291.1 hypothetical protein SEA_JEMERALD_52 [Microbacterium phage Jemerald]